MFSQQEREVVGILHGSSEEIRGGYLAQLCPRTTLWVIFPQQGARAMSKGVLVGTCTNPIREQANNFHVGGQQSMPVLTPWGCLTYLRCPAQCVNYHSWLVPTFLHCLRVWRLACLDLDSLNFRWQRRADEEQPFTTSLIPSSWSQVRNHNTWNLAWQMICVTVGVAEHYKAELYDPYPEELSI